MTYTIWRMSVMPSFLSPGSQRTQHSSSGSCSRFWRPQRRNNSLLQITGALLYSGGHFAQVLEGPKAAINERFRRISQDVRHTHVTPLIYEPADVRQFANWSMVLCGSGEVHDLPRNFEAKPSPGSVEAGDLGKSIVTSLATAIDRRSMP